MKIFIFSFPPSDEPQPSSDKPAPSSDDPAPSSDDPAPSSDEPSPSSDEPQPSSDEPSPLNYFSDEHCCFSDDIICFSDDIICFSDNTFCFSDNIVCFSDDIICFSDDTICFSDDIICSTDDIIYLSDDTIYPFVNTFYPFVNNISCFYHPFNTNFVLMLKYKVHEILLSKGKLKPHAWLIKFCGFSPSKASKILNNNQKAINLHDISLLCEMLHCTPNDLYYWESKSGHPLPADHPCLTQLSHPMNLGNWEQVLKKMKPDKLSELYLKAQELIDEK